MKRIVSDNMKYDIDLSPYFALEGHQPFKDRHATMPWRGAVPISADKRQDTWQKLINSTFEPRKRLV